jgi:vitamin B12 transporter
MPRRLYLLLTTALAAPAMAQDAPAPDTIPGTIIVTALRTPLPLDRVASSITVLDHTAIDASQVLAVSDLLVRTPGVTMSRTGGYGTTTGVRIRGAESDQTVVVIDGVKLNDPSSPGGGYDFGDLFVGDADRIEILRGPQSTLWGSQAIGGVVNIVTDVPTTPLGGSAEAEGGSRGTASGRVGIGGTSDAITWRIAGNAMRTDGISAIAPAFGGEERDGYWHVGGSGRFEARLTPDIAIDLRGYWSHGRVDLDSSFGPPDTPEYSLSTNWTGYAGLNVALFDGRLRNRIAYTRDQIDRDNHDPSLIGSTDTFIAHGRNEHIEYQGNLAIVDGWDATFGAEHEHSRFSAISPQFQTDPENGSVSIDSVYGQLVGTVMKGLTLTGGIRYDDHQTFGGKTLFSGGAVWSIGQTRLRATWSEGFKAPTLYQLFSEYGNRDLRPEQAHGWDAGIEQGLFDGHVTLSATWFDRRTHNLVEFAFDPPRVDRPFGYYQNVDRASARGIETAATAKFGRITLDANYTWTDAEDRSPGATFGNDLIRRPRNTAYASASYVWPFGLSTTAAVTRVSHSFEDGANTIRLDGYTLVDLRAEMPVGHGLAVFGRVENLTDKTYETAYRYGTLGRSFYGGVRAKF